MSWTNPKTVLGNRIEWDTSKIPGKRKKGTSSGKDDQLWRCRKTKKFEASLLENLPRGACFVDAGAHFGDTVLTMALHARDTLKRRDIRFVAFEPNRRKAQFIEECAAANGFGRSDAGDNDVSIQVISCVLGDETSRGGARARRERDKDWCKYDGRTSYEIVDDDKRLLQTSLAPGANNGIDDENTSDEESCSSASTSTASSSSENVVDVRRLDDFFDVINPVGFLHVDVEGWEAKVLSGASKLLSADASADDEDVESSSQCYLLAETFSRREARSRGQGFSQTHEDDVLEVMSKFPLFSRGEDIVDGERNLFFARGG